MHCPNSHFQAGDDQGQNMNLKLEDDDDPRPFLVASEQDEVTSGLLLGHPVFPEQNPNFYMILHNQDGLFPELSRESEEPFYDMTRHRQVVVGIVLMIYIEMKTSPSSFSGSIQN